LTDRTSSADDVLERVKGIEDFALP